jgi:hypothetical protein
MNILKLFFLLLISLSIEINAQNSDSIKYWHKENKVNWVDFKGKPPDSSGYRVALSFVQINTQGYWEQNMPNYKVYTVFKKYKSWSKDTSLSTLSHEQLHFDIGELFARKMRKAMLKLRAEKNKSINDYLKTLSNYHKECIQTNDLYDTETAHGVYKSKQEEWNKKIAKELCELKKYEVDYISQRVE